jgi:1,4-dihydroxy-6-naphthoate synthase
MKLTLGHSPDPDDAFMFYAMAKDKIDMGEYELDHVLQDIETLNQRAENEELDLTAVSMHAFAYLTDKYAMMPCGASMGDNYGPIVVAADPNFKQENLRDAVIAIPGLKTSSFLALQLYLGKEFKYEVVPFDKIFDAVKNGDVDCGLVIHEGQLTWKDEGFHLVCDLGKWWLELTDGWPLPLGGNVVKRSLGKDVINDVTKIMQEIIAFGLKERQAALEHSMAYGRNLNQNLTHEFVGMYVNELTVDYGERGRAAVEKFYNMAFEKGLLPQKPIVDFVQV